MVKNKKQTKKDQQVKPQNGQQGCASKINFEDCLQKASPSVYQSLLKQELNCCQNDTQCREPRQSRSREIRYKAPLKVCPQDRLKLFEMCLTPSTDDNSVKYIERDVRKTFSEVNCAQAPRNIKNKPKGQQPLLKNQLQYSLNSTMPKKNDKCSDPYQRQQQCQQQMEYEQMQNQQNCKQSQKINHNNCKVHGMGNNRSQQSQQLPQKEVKPLFFFKANNFLIADQLTLEDILNKIYFDGFIYQDIKEYIIPALRNITGLNNFFDILFNTIRNYSEKIKASLIHDLKDLIVSNKSQIAGGEGVRLTTTSSSYYKKFSKYSTYYIELINKIFENYKIIEVQSLETEKVVNIYLDYFIEHSKQVKFSCTDLHRRIFVFFVYNDPAIKQFIESITQFFNEITFYANKYSTAASQLQQINQILKKKSWFPPLDFQPINIEISDNIYEDYSDDEDEDESNLLYTQQANPDKKNDYILISHNQQQQQQNNLINQSQKLTLQQQYQQTQNQLNYKENEFKQQQQRKQQLLLQQQQLILQQQQQQQQLLLQQQMQQQQQNQQLSNQKSRQQIKKERKLRKLKKKQQQQRANNNLQQSEENIMEIKSNNNINNSSSTKSKTNSEEDKENGNTSNILPNNINHTQNLSNSSEEPQSEKNPRSSMVEINTEKNEKNQHLQKQQQKSKAKQQQNQQQQQQQQQKEQKKQQSFSKSQSKQTHKDKENSSQQQQNLQKQEEQEPQKQDQQQHQTSKEKEQNQQQIECSQNVNLEKEDEVKKFERIINKDWNVLEDQKINPNVSNQWIQKMREQFNKSKNQLNAHTILANTSKTNAINTNSASKTQQ